MAQASARLSLQGMLDFVPKSPRPLAAISEAIANSLESIAERQKSSDWKGAGEVKVSLHYAGLDEKTRDLQFVEIADNGVGFDQANFERFLTFFDRSKGYNNRGSGRAQYLHLANRIDVTSQFQQGQQVVERQFVCTPSNFEPKNELKQVEHPEIGSKVVLRELKLDKEAREYFGALTADELQDALRSHFLLWLHLARVARPTSAPIIELEIVRNGEIESTRKLDPATLPTPRTGKIAVPYYKLRDAATDVVDWQRQDRSETLEWAHFKLKETELSKNGVLLCSKGVAVERVPFDALKTNEAIDGHRFLTAFYGEALNRGENVSHAVDRFTLPRRSEVESVIRENGALFLDPTQDLLFLDDIEEAVQDALPDIYKELLARRETKERDVEAIARAHGIESDIVKETKISLSDTETQITEKLFKQQAQALAQQSLKIKKVFEQLQKLDPTADDYQEQLLSRTDELLGLIPQQNKQELSRYVIRRQMVAKILGMILDRSLDAAKPGRKGEAKRQDKEGLVHDLLIKRKATTKQGPNDLWVLNEEFLHFEGFSDVPFENIRDAEGNKILREISDEDLAAYGLKNKALRRPDIFLFAEEEQCILVELKAPDVDLSDHLNQLEKYCNLIANFSTKPLKRFHCYLIGEVVSPIDIASRYRQDMNGDWINRTDSKVMRFEKGRQEEELGEAHFEIIKLSSLHKRALRRNKSFADRLGIGDAALI